MLNHAAQDVLRWRSACLALLLVLACASPPAFAGAIAATSGAQMQGAHVVSWGTVEVDATLEVAFAVLTDYDRMADFLPGMLASGVVARNGNSVVVDQSADEGAYLFVQRVDARLAIDESPPTQLTIRALSGSFKELVGSYLLTRRSGRTRIEYQGRFLPDFQMPPMIGIHVVQRSLERHLGALAKEMMRRSAGTGASAAPDSTAQTPPGGTAAGGTSPGTRASGSAMPQAPRGE